VIIKAIIINKATHTFPQGYRAGPGHDLAGIALDPTSFMCPSEILSKKTYFFLLKQKEILPPKSSPSEGCFGCHKTAFSVQKRIFLQTKKADQKQFENWRVSLVQNSTKLRGELMELAT